MTTTPRRVDVGRLRRLAEKAAPYERVETYNGKLWNCRQADLGVALTATEVLALLDELDAARLIVDTVRTVKLLPPDAFAFAQLVGQYDRAIAAAADDGRDGG